MAQSAGFAVTISAIDQLSKPLQNISREIGQLGRQIGAVQKEGVTGAAARGSFFERAQEFSTRGYLRVGHGLREIGHAAREAGRGLSEAFEPITALTGVGGAAIGGLGLAGVAEGLTKLGESARELQNLSRRIGVPTQAITSLGNAASLAGIQSGTMAAAIETLSQKLYNAALGTDAESIAFFKQFGIATRDAAGHIRTGAQAIGEVADAIKKEQNSLTQGVIATKAFDAAGRDLLPVLRGGSEGLAKLREEGDKLSGNQSHWVETGVEFSEAQDRAKVATQGLTRAIGSELQEALTPTVNKFAEWLGDINQSKEKTEIATKVVEALATALGVTLVAGLAKAAIALNAWWALPAMKFLTGPIGLGLLALQFGTSSGISGFIPEKATPAMPTPGLGEGNVPEDTPEERARRRENQGGIIGWIGRNIFGGGKKEFTAPIPPAGGVQKQSFMGIGHVAPNAERIAFYRQYALSKGLNPDAIAATVGGEGLHRYIGDSGTSFGDFQLHVGGGMGDAAVNAGINIRDPSTWKQQGQFAIDQMAANKGKPGWYAGQWHGAPGWAAQAYSNPPAGGGGGFFASLGKVFGIGGAQAAPMPGFGGVAARRRPEAPAWINDQNTGGLRNVPGLDLAKQQAALDQFKADIQNPSAAPRSPFPPGMKFNSRGEPYADTPAADVPKVAASMAAIKASMYGGAPWALPTPAGGGAPDIGGGAPAVGAGEGGNLIPGGALDSKHSVLIDINGAPQGTRARITEAKGPADTSLRTHYAFGAI